MRAPRLFGPVLASSLLVLAPRAQDMERAKKLFVTNCAACHGETGDGKGTTELDRPARSFQDGGFSFGNTPEALFKTISTGIPGSPMPAFDASLKEAERRLLASYVVTLGFVFFRMLVVGLDALEVGTTVERVGVAAWFCWAVPLLIAEPVLQWRKQARP